MRPSMLTLGLMSIGWIVGCSGISPSASLPAESHGVVYYLDGAGGGGALLNWGRNVKHGLDLAGYQGDFQIFPWETRLGVLADQEEGVGYKRKKASELAALIADCTKANPNTPVNLMGLSAGTAVAIYTLEALPASSSVDNVVLLGASLSSDYDMTKALRHVKNDLYVFTSDHDAVLKVLVPFSGSADRRYVGANLAGLQGFHLPPGANAETRRLYAKVTNITWQPEFEQEGDWGGHTGATRPRFVQHYIAPLLMNDGPRFMRVRSLVSHSDSRGLPIPK